MEEKSKLEKTFRRKGVLWMTKQIAEDEDRLTLLRVTLREFFFYAIFLIIVTIVAVAMTTPSMYYLTRALQELFLEKEFTTHGEARIKFEQISNVRDFWAYCETILFEGFYWDHWYNNATTIADDQNILYENKLLGVPRLRQIKVRNDSCQIHEYFRRMFVACYGAFSRQAEDTKPFGVGEGTAWTYNSLKETGSITHWARLGHYHGGGFYEDLSKDRAKSKQAIATLKKNLWIQRGTRCVFVDLTIYNANMNLFCVVKLVFEFPPTGGVVPSHSFRTVKLIRYVTPFDYFVFACELVAVAFLVYFTAEEIQEATYYASAYLKFFWNYMDLLLLALGYSLLILGIIRRAAIKAALAEKLELEDEYANFEWEGLVQFVFNCIFALFVFVAYAKIFKYLSFNKTMGQLNNTLSRCAGDIASFSIMFFIIFIAYAELGYLLFGTQVESFSSFGVSMFTLLRTILGDFDYMEIERVNRILAPIFFLTYIFFVFFVLLNMFLAIINDTYSDVKTELAMAPDEMQMSEYIKRGFYRLLSKCGCGRCIPKATQAQNEYSMTVKEIRGALKRCGFSELEIEMFFNRYNIDPTAEIGEYDIAKLMTDLEKPAAGESSRVQARPTTSAGAPLVSVDDFVVQQERLAMIEKTIEQLTKKVDTLLKKLDTLESVKKGTV